MHLKRPTERDFDTWLTGIPDEELQLLSRLTDQAFTDHAQPSETLTHILALIMHFHGKPAPVAAISAMLYRFAVSLAIEMLRRQGDVMKEGTYTLDLSDPGSKFTMTKQGKAKQHGDT